MNSALVSPAKASFFGLPGTVLFILIPLVGVGIFAYIIYRRFLPLRLAAADPRFSRIGERIGGVLKYWLAQVRHPRYRFAGIMHILLFAGFLILSVRSLTLVFMGFIDGFALPGFDGALGHLYGILKDLTTTWVLVVAAVLLVRRAFSSPNATRSRPATEAGSTPVRPSWFWG